MVHKIPSVWIVNYAGHDYGRAEEFGPLKYLTKGYVNLSNLDRVFLDIATAVEQTENDDYLLWAGLIVLNVIAALAWMEKHQVVKALMWDKKVNDYRRLTVSRDQIVRLQQELMLQRQITDA